MTTHCNCVPCPPSEEPCTHYRYCVQAIVEDADIGDERSYSECLWLVTNKTWGDTVSNCMGDLCRPPDGVPGLADIMAAIAYFQGRKVAPPTWLDIANALGKDEPDQSVGLADIMAAIDGFQCVERYPGDGPLNCPLP